MRIKRAVNKNKHKKAILKQAKGYWGRRSKVVRVANEAVMKSGQYAYVGRKLKKRDMRSLWIVRINAAVRSNGLTYSQFMNGLKKAGVNLDRKVLAQMAYDADKNFETLIETAKRFIANNAK